MTNPHWLRSFLAVVETGGFTRAAAKLGLTQAAVSQHVRHLEEELGPLLVRRPKEVELTPTGVALREYCQELELADRRLKARLSDSVADSGEVSIITPGSVGLALCPRLLALQVKHPGLVIRHRFAPDPDTLEAVLRKQYEMGVVTLRPDEPRLSALPFGQEALELVVPAGVKVKRWEDLERLGFVDHPDGHAMASRLLARRFPGNPGVRALPARGFVNQIALILEPVALGLGFTIIPRHAREAFSRPEAIQVSKCGAPVIDTLWLIHRKEWPLSTRASWVLGQIWKAPPFKRPSS